MSYVQPLQRTLLFFWECARLGLELLLRFLGLSPHRIHLHRHSQTSVPLYIYYRKPSIFRTFESLDLAFISCFLSLLRPPLHKLEHKKKHSLAATARCTNLSIKNKITSCFLSLLQPFCTRLSMKLCIAVPCCPCCSECDAVGYSCTVTLKPCICICT